MSISLDRPVPLSTLDAVNVVLQARGERPTAQLGASARSAAREAEDALASQSSIVQGQGWNFNTDHSVELVPNTSGEILLPEGLITFTPERIPTGSRPVDRGGRLYDSGNNTYVFSGPVTATLLFLLPFTDLPQPARWYIALSAAYEYGNRSVPGSPSLRPTEGQVIAAKARLEQNDLNTGPSNLRTTNPHFRRMRRRR